MADGHAGLASRGAATARRQTWRLDITMVGSRKKEMYFLAYEIENDYLCKVNVMDIHKSIMQIQGDIPRQLMRRPVNPGTRTLTRGDAPTLSTLNLFYEKL